jgi:hypothetical protein
LVTETKMKLTTTFTGPGKGSSRLCANGRQFQYYTLADLLRITDRPSRQSLQCSTPHTLNITYTRSRQSFQCDPADHTRYYLPTLQPVIPVRSGRHTQYHLHTLQAAILVTRLFLHSTLMPRIHHRYLHHRRLSSSSPKVRRRVLPQRLANRVHGNQCHQSQLHSLRSHHSEVCHQRNHQPRHLRKCSPHIRIPILRDDRAVCQNFHGNFTNPT